MTKYAPKKSNQNLTKNVGSSVSYGNASAKSNPYEEKAGGWIRLKNENGTFRFEWNDAVENQEAATAAYPDQDATYLGKRFFANGVNGSNYKLDNDGTVWLLTAKNTEKEQVDISAVNGKAYTPTFSKGTYNGRVKVDDSFKPFENIDVKAYFEAPNLSSHEKRNLKIIQVVYSPNPAHREDLGEMDGKLAFVDGGKNSAKHHAEPWYGFQDETNEFNYDKTPEKNGLSFKLSDQPGAITQISDWLIETGGDRQSISKVGAPHYDALHFEAYVVLPDYNGSGQIKIIGRVDWGFKNDNWEITKTIQNPQMIATDAFSDRAQAIWDNDYGDDNKYKLFGEE